MQPAVSGTRLRICIDTNRLIAAVGNSMGAAAVILGMVVDGDVGMVVSPEIVTEYESRIHRPSVQKPFARRGFPMQLWAELVSGIVANGELIVPSGEPPACRDESDRKFLHCAVAGQVDYLVTGDRDLLVLGNVEGIPIVTPAELLRRAQVT